MLKKAGSGEGNLMDTKLRFWREKNNYKRKNKKDYLKKKEAVWRVYLQSC